MKKYYTVFFTAVIFIFVSCREGIVDFPAGNQTGSVFVTSSPNGADIYINQSWTGRSTPDSITGLQPGSYQIKLKLVGYADTVIAVSIIKGRKSQYSITLRDY